MSTEAIDPRIGLMITLVHLLTPLFEISGVDTALAQRMAISAINAYQPETRADLVNIARTIAFSMTAIALLGAAGSPDKTFAEQMRAFGRANALNRSADQSERGMMQRRRYQQAKSAAEPSAQDEPIETTAPRAEIAEIGEVIQEYQATRPVAPAVAAPKSTPIPEPTPAATPQPAPVNNPLQPRAATPPTVIHATPSQISPNNTSPNQADTNEMTPYMQALLNPAALRRMLEQPAPQSRRA